jgi:hypothetical protein
MNEDEAQEVFLKCKAKYNCNRVKNGSFYCCACISSGEALSMFPIGNMDKIELNETVDCKERLREYLLFTKMPNACHWCSGFDESLPPVEKAIQLNAPLPYNKV